MILEAGDKTVEKEFTIAAVADMPNGLNRYNSFVLPKAVLDDICGLSMDYYWSIAAGDKEVKAVEEQLRAVTEEDQNLKMRTLRRSWRREQKMPALHHSSAMSLWQFWGELGLSNLINTMINSIYVRRRELGIMQAVRPLGTSAGTDAPDGRGFLHRRYAYPLSGSGKSAGISDLPLCEERRTAGNYQLPLSGSSDHSAYCCGTCDTAVAYLSYHEKLQETKYD